MTDSNAGLKPVIIGNQIMLDGEVLVQVGGSVEALIMWCLAHYVFPFNYQGGKKTAMVIGWTAGVEPFSRLTKQAKTSLRELGVDVE